MCARLAANLALGKVGAMTYVYKYIKSYCIDKNGVTFIRNDMCKLTLWLIILMLIID